MDYCDLYEHLSIFNETKDTETGYEWPITNNSIPSLTHHIIAKGRTLRRVHLSNIKHILGELAHQLKTHELVMALDCKISTSAQQTFAELQFAHTYCTHISPSAISGKHIKPVLHFYRNRGIFQLMLVKNGLFWLRMEEGLQKSQT